MSSPPSPTTSTRAATLSGRKARRSISFPSLASFNPFRSKSAPQPCPPTEPFLVAPGIWSTDATAKVFGYLEPYLDGDSKLGRSKSARPHKQNNSQSPTSGHSTLLGINLLKRHREVHGDEGIDDFSTRAHHQKREAWERARQEGRDEVRLEREGRSRRGRMKSLSQDDQLTERGANPRTGIISPYITSDETGSNSDYISRGIDRSPPSRGSRRTSSGRWMQDGASWSFVEETIANSADAITNDQPSRHGSVKIFQGSSLAEKPGVDDHKSDIITTEQIRRYQQGVERVCRSGGGRHAMVDPEALPTPRELTPEGPSTPPNKLYKIRRKEVGSALIPRDRSDDTTIALPKQRSTSPCPPAALRLPSMDKQQVRIFSPSMVALGVAPRTPLDVPSSFLGPHHRCSRTVSAGQFQSQYPLSPQTNLQARQLQFQSQAEPAGPSEARFARQASSPTLNQRLPRLDFLQPSHFANLEPSSYRRPAYPLPPSLRTGHQKRQLVEDAATITTTIISPRHAPRPKVQRQEGSNAVPRASHQKHDSHNHREYPSTNIPRIEVSEPTDSTKPVEKLPNLKSGEVNQFPPYLSHQNLVGVKENALRVNHLESNPYLTCRDKVKFPTANDLTLPSPIKSTEATQDTTMNQMPRTHLYPSHLCPGGEEEVVPRANHHRPRKRVTVLDPVHARTATPQERGTEKLASNTPDTRSRSTHPNQQYQQIMNPAGTEDVDPGAKAAARVAMLGDDLPPHQRQPRDPQLKSREHQPTSNQRSGARDARLIVSEEGESADGIIRTYDPLGDVERDSILLERNCGEVGRGTNVNDPAQHERPLINEGGVCFTGKWAVNDKSSNEMGSNQEDNERSTTSVAVQTEETTPTTTIPLVRRRSLLQKGHEIATCLAVINAFLQPKALLISIQRRLWHMVIHVASTLNQNSPVVKTLRDGSGGGGEIKVGSRAYLKAVREVVLAGFYLVVLINVALVVRRVVVVVVGVGYWVCHPWEVVGGVVRWCLVS